MVVSPCCVLQKRGLHFGYTFYFNHEIRERETLNLHDRARHHWIAGENLLSAFNPCGKGCIHVRYKEDLIYDVGHCGPIPREHLLNVGVGPAHLRFHIAEPEDLTRVVMADLPGEIDRVSDPHRLGIPVLLFPRHIKACCFLADCHGTPPVGFSGKLLDDKAKLSTADGRLLRGKRGYMLQAEAVLVSSLGRLFFWREVPPEERDAVCLASALECHFQTLHEIQFTLHAPETI